MTNLTIIYLQSNCLTELPESIENLENLEILDVSCNELSSVPSTIGHLKKLKKLVLTQNKITMLPDSVGQLTHLVSLQLNFNFLQGLPYSLRNCLLLQELCIDRNNLRTIPNFLTRLPNLEVLSVCGNQLVYLPLVPFAAIQRLCCDTNSHLSFLPYQLACQMNETSLNPLVAENALHIDCYGCFLSCQSGNDTCSYIVSVRDGENDWWIRLPPHLFLSTSHVVPPLTELVLKSFIWRQFGKSVVRCDDRFRNVHHFRVERWFNDHYDNWLETLHKILPSTLIEFLRQGPTAFCFDCGKPIFQIAYPLFVPKMIVQRPSCLKKILCCLLFCSPFCFERCHRMAETWEISMFDSRLENWKMMS